MRYACIEFTALAYTENTGKDEAEIFEEILSSIYHVSLNIMSNDNIVREMREKCARRNRNARAENEHGISVPAFQILNVKRQHK